MAKTLSCRDVGLDCDQVIRGETEEEVMQKGAEHGKSAHGMTDVQLNDPQMQQKVRGLIRDA
jgi:predicted small metal-binding protein